jgi:hypothetical protein
VTWNYDLEAAPLNKKVLVTCVDTCGDTSVEEDYRTDLQPPGAWYWNDGLLGRPRVIAWMPMPDPAPLPEDHAAP